MSIMDKFALKFVIYSIFKRPKVAGFTNQSVRWFSQEHADKQLVDKPTPYQRPKQKCLLCRHDIVLDYKNPRLLSQFVSSLTGQIFDKHITGLCEKQQARLQREIRKSRLATLMPVHFRHPKYNKDPSLFNPERPQRPNPW